ncbi:MAG: NifB/NifX family molybdenum-iron cluster-binding protein [Verrucomicrobia bacterium]|nr:NifB/NifX family molybdenum-iron cluster-binding protein [Verrucomicrobiota bacterium]
MKLCIPVATDEGLNSVVYGHFGSAPLFVLVDSETMTVEPLANRDQTHVHGACNPLRALAGRQVDAVIVGGIGPGAVNGLQRAGIAVYQSPAQTLAEAVAQFNQGRLPKISLESACSSHGDGGCAHH